MTEVVFQGVTWTGPRQRELRKLVDVGLLLRSGRIGPDKVTPAVFAWLVGNGYACEVGRGSAIAPTARAIEAYNHLFTSQLELFAT